MRIAGAARGVKRFQDCDNRLPLAEQAGLGTADLAQINVRRLPIEKARYPTVEGAPEQSGLADNPEEFHVRRAA